MANKHIPQEKKNNIMADLRRLTKPVTYKECKKIGRRYGVSDRTVYRMSLTASALTSDEARAVLKVPSVSIERTARADVFPTTTVARTRGSVVVIFDVNASIVDVINTVTSAWQRARNGTDATYEPGEENARAGSGG